MAGKTVYPLGDIGKNNYIFINQECPALQLPSSQKTAPDEITMFTTPKNLISSHKRSTRPLGSVGSTHSFLRSHYSVKEAGRRHGKKQREEKKVS